MSDTDLPKLAAFSRIPSEQELGTCNGVFSGGRKWFLFRYGVTADGHMVRWNEDYVATVLFVCHASDLGRLGTGDGYDFEWFDEWADACVERLPI